VEHAVPRAGVDRLLDTVLHQQLVASRIVSAESIQLGAVGCAGDQQGRGQLELLARTLDADTILEQRLGPPLHDEHADLAWVDRVGATTGQLFDEQLQVTGGLGGRHCRRSQRGNRCRSGLLRSIHKGGCRCFVKRRGADTAAREQKYKAFRDGSVLHSIIHLLAAGTASAYRHHPVIARQPCAPSARLRHSARRRRSSPAHDAWRNHLARSMGGYRTHTLSSTRRRRGRNCAPLRASMLHGSPSAGVRG
jgi:hypothetical protein